MAATLLLIGGEGALHALQTAVISAGLPFAIILTLMTISLIKGIEVSHTKQMKIRDLRKFKGLRKQHKEKNMGS